jgi:nucleotide-binding universal stress UspA family protein
MFGRMILGFDGTDQSRDALALARLLASDGRRCVVVSHVVPRALPFDSRTREYVQTVRSHVHAVLDPALAALSGLRAEARPIESESVPRGLHELAEEEGASLVVIGSTHRGPVGRVVLGSVGEILLAGTPAAVAVAPRGFAGAGVQSLGVVGAAYNGSPEGMAALRTAAALAAESAATLRAFAVDEGFMWDRHLLRRELHGSERVDERLARALAEVGAEDAERIVMTGAAATCLAEGCADADLLVIGSRSYGPLRHALLGSVSAKLMRSCAAPLLVVPRGEVLASDPAAVTAAAGRRPGHNRL